MLENYEIIITHLKSVKVALIIYTEQTTISHAFKLAMKCKKLLSLSDSQIFMDKSSISAETMLKFHKKYPINDEDYEYCHINDFLNGGYKKYEKEDWA